MCCSTTLKLHFERSILSCYPLSPTTRGGLFSSEDNPYQIGSHVNQPLTVLCTDYQDSRFLYYLSHLLSGQSAGFVPTLVSHILYLLAYPQYPTRCLIRLGRINFHYFLFFMTNGKTIDYGDINFSLYPYYTNCLLTMIFIYCTS